MKQTKTKRIFLLVSSMGAGGAERVAATLCNAWATRGDDVTLVVTFSGRGPCFYKISSDVRLIYMADLVKRSRRTPLGYLRRLLALRQLISNAAPDIVISFLTNVSAAAIAATFGTGMPVVACERISLESSASLPLAYRIARGLMYPFADVVTVQTEAAALTYKSVRPRIKRVEVVANPIPEGLPERTQARPWTGSRRRLIAVGRFSKQKQFDLLIAMFAGLATRFPDWDLWIWGDGPLRSYLENRIAELGIGGRVFLPGATQAVWEELLQADLFALSSSYEGFPNVLLEAMAVGLPCVAFDCPHGPRDLSGNGTYARLVPVGDVQGFRDSLALLMNDPALSDRLGASAATWVRGRYSLKEVVARWDEIFEVAIRRQRQ